MTAGHMYYLGSRGFIPLWGLGQRPSNIYYLFSNIYYLFSFLSFISMILAKARLALPTPG
jgi:hypothetical protein